MPSWNIHLEAGTRLAGKLEFTGRKRQEFLLGCLLPDINNGYINKVKIKKHHCETHYAYDQKSSLNFYAENREQINSRDPIFLGYLFHLYTDGFFNYDFYRTIKRDPLGEGLDHEQKSDIKHHDFWLYDTTFHHHLGFDSEDLPHLTKRANAVSVADITESDLLDVERILTSDELNSAIRGGKYQFYTKQRLDHLLEDTLESFTNDYLRSDDA